MNKKKIITLCLVVCLIVTAVAGVSLAYFTDTKSATNTFTVGNVSIELIESKYHRAGSGGSGDPSIGAPTGTADGKKYIPDGTTIFTDEEIKADAESYNDYISERGKNMVPGKFIAKSPYVVNTGSNDAYIRIRVMIPTKGNRDYHELWAGGVIKSQFCTTAITSGEFMHNAKRNDYPFITDGDKPDGYVDENGVRYDIYTFIRNEPLKPGEMTEWNVWNYIGIDANATSKNIQTAIDKGAIIKSDDGSLTVNVLVFADAIQAEGFTDTVDANGKVTATAAQNAFAAFDKA